MTALFTRFHLRLHRAMVPLGQHQLERPLQQLGAVLAHWAARRRSRRELAEMSERMLLDIGTTRADAWCESSKPFWRA